MEPASPAFKARRNSQALYLMWNQWHICVKATSPAQLITDIRTSSHWPLQCPNFNPNWLLGLSNSDSSLAIQGQTLNCWAHVTKFSLNEGYTCASNLYYLWMEVTYILEEITTQSFARCCPVGPTPNAASGTFHDRRDDTKEDTALMVVSTAWDLIAKLNICLSKFPADDTFEWHFAEWTMCLPWSPSPAVDAVTTTASTPAPRTIATGSPPCTTQRDPSPGSSLRAPQSSNSSPSVAFIQWAEMGLIFWAAVIVEHVSWLNKDCFSS